MTIRRGVAALIGLLPLPAAAHHSGVFGEELVEITGTISALSWQNPHVRLVIDVPDGDGGSERWTLEGASANLLAHRGIGPSSVPIGVRAYAHGPRSRHDPTAMAAAVVVIDGATPLSLWPDVAARLGLGDTEPIPSATAPGETPTAAGGDGSLFRVWSPRRHASPDLASLPLTPRARSAAASYDPLVDDPGLRCEPRGMPAMLDTPLPIEFSNAGDSILMRFEEWNGLRTIHMSPGRGPAVQNPSRYGVSFGRWEAAGATLAVFTLYIDYPYLDARGTPQSAAVTVLERYTPSADGTRLSWETIVTDVASFSEPITWRGEMAFVPDTAVLPYECGVEIP